MLNNTKQHWEETKTYIQVKVSTILTMASGNVLALTFHQLWRLTVRHINNANLHNDLETVSKT